jgi:hypothetical protein
MNILNNNSFQLIRRDIRELKSYLFQDNDINDWDKIIVIYNFYLFYSHFYILYNLMNYINHNNTNLLDQYKSIYLFFFILCNIRNSYLYFILNVSKINNNLANSLYNNTKKYFL